MDTCLEGPFQILPLWEALSPPHPCWQARGQGGQGSEGLQGRSAGPGQAGAHSLLKGVLAVEEGEEGGLADQPVVQAGVRAGPPCGSQPGPEGVRWGPGPRGQAGVAGPFQVGGVGSQDERVLWGSGPRWGRTWGCTEVLREESSVRRKKWGASLLPTQPTPYYPLTCYQIFKQLYNKMKNKRLCISIL